MGAKLKAALLLLGAAALTSGCTQLKRLAPPGIVKYEELAGDEPPNPVIQERIAERRSTVDARFPNLSEQPQERPRFMSRASAAEAMALLEREREEIAATDAMTRAAAAAEAAEAVSLPGDRSGEGRSLSGAAEALDAAAKRDADLAARDRRQPLPQPEPVE